MAILAWVKSRKVFLKIQEGTGDNLSREDIAGGFVDYVLWSTFTPDCLDLDDTLEMNVTDSGMVMFRSPVKATDTVADCFASAFGTNPAPEDILVLMQDSP